jgi:glycosyltransferase involved in cell wall biosynthesis
MVNKRTVGISVIICFYNSVRRLSPTLQSIFNQEGLENISWELILVDNASTDTSVSFTKELITTANFKNARIVSEQKGGLNYARKKGINESQYEYILFCDDDNWLNPSYVYHSFSFLKENPDYGVVGGNGLAQCEIDPPKWFDSYKSMYATGCRKDGDVANVYGAGMCFRNKLFDDFVPQMSDRKGKSLISGGDSEMCDHALKKGYKIRQLCSNTFTHFIPKERLTTRYIYRLAKGRGKTMAHLRWLRENKDKQKISVIYRLRKDVNSILLALFKGDFVKFLFELNRSNAYWFTFIKL